MNPSNDPEQGGWRWVLHARCPYPHTKSAVRILHKPLMQSSLIMRPATVLYKPSRDIVHGLPGGVIPLPIRFPVRIMLAGRVPSGRRVTGRFASSPFAFAWATA